MVQVEMELLTGHRTCTYHKLAQNRAKMLDVSLLTFRLSNDSSALFDLRLDLKKHASLVLGQVIYKPSSKTQSLYGSPPHSHVRCFVPYGISVAMEKQDDKRQAEDGAKVRYASDHQAGLGGWDPSNPTWLRLMTKGIIQLNFQVPQTPCLGVDDLLERIKPFGRFQYFLTFLYTYACFAHLCNMQFMGFGGTKPKFQCSDAQFDDGGPSDNCRVYYNCSKGNLTFVYDFYSIVETWSLVCDESYYVSLITTIQMIGVLCGGLFAGPITDVYGRKWTYFWILAMELASGALSGVSTSWPMFAVFRFVIGFALGGALVTGWVFVAEMTTNRYRLIIRAVGGAFFAQFDETMVGYLTRNWRWFSIIGNLQVLPMLILVALFTYESPRWLLQKGRKAEAEEVLRKIARFNRTSHLLPVKMFGPDPEPTCPEQANVCVSPKTYFIWDLFRSRKLAIRTTVMVISYFALATINYGMFFGIGDLPLNIYLSMILLSVVSALELPVAFYDAHNVRLNRKYLLVGASGVTVLANIAVTVLLSLRGGSLTERAYDGLVSTISIFGQLASNIAFDTAYMYSVELFPTLLRSNAGALCSVGARLGSILAPQLLYLEQLWSPLPYCCFSVIAGIGVLVDALFLPNTKNLRLPETVHSANQLDDPKQGLENPDADTCESK